MNRIYWFYSEIFILPQMKTILLALFLALAIDSFAQQISVAVLPSDGDATAFSGDDLFALTDKVRSVALETLPSETFTLLTQDVVIKRLGGAENFIKECRESSCIVDLGKKAQVDYVAQASVGKLRDKMRIRVEVYNVATSGLVGMYDGGGKYFDDYFELLESVEKNVPNIFKKIPGVIPDQAKTASVVSPAQPSANKEQREKIQWYIDKGIDKHKEDIQKEASSLSYIDRTNLYDENKKGFFNLASFGYAGLNTIGLGIGSYIQGDTKSGVIQSVAEVVGWGLVTYNGISWWLYSRDYDGSDEQEWDDKNNNRKIIAAASVIILCSSRVAGWVFAFLYQDKYNKEYNKSLDEALNANSNISYSIDPLIIPTDKSTAFGLALNLRF